jgi:FlaA1/EpsC-like NDP-sugar epimerase
MATGATGSIGRELCRQIAALEPLALVGFDQAETSLFYLERELAQASPALRQHRPSVVFHAAGYKHMPMLESKVLVAARNNIVGAWNAATSAAAHGMERFVQIWSDKAVRLAGIIGATKRAAELVIRALAQNARTRFMAVRFSNVRGSSGSVIPIFEHQTAAAGAVTVAQSEMNRYS